MTDYVVLYLNDDGEWSEAKGQFAAASRQGAVEAAMAAWKDELGAGGEFRAVPARSWQPVKVAVETAFKAATEVDILRQVLQVLREIQSGTREEAA